MWPTPRAEDADGPDMKGPGGTVPERPDATYAGWFTAKGSYAAVLCGNGTREPCAVSMVAQSLQSWTQALRLAEQSVVQHCTNQLWSSGLHGRAV
jgi:hypothetical protein